MKMIYSGKILTIVFVLMFCCITSSMASTCDAIKVIVSALNVRTGPGTNYNITGVIENGQTYMIAGVKSGNWQKIWYDGQVSWIYATNYTEDAIVSCGMVTASTLNVRSGPGTEYRVVGTAHKDSKWAIIGEEGQWCKIWYASEERWVHGGYLDQPGQTPEIELTAFNINNNASTTATRFVIAYSAYTASTASYYRISENSSFVGVSWKAYAPTVSYTLSDGEGTKTVYFQLKNADGRLSNVRSDSIVYDSPSTQTGYEIDRYTFFSNLRSKFGSINQSQTDGISFLLGKMEDDIRAAINNKTAWMRQIAYVFSTIKHEVANTYKPITEYSNTNCVNYDGGCRYKGRGYVQLTHKYNYSKMSPVVGVDLVANPERALKPQTAYTVISYGMHNGSFTGRKLGTYIQAGKTDYYNARRVVNGIDKANLLGAYARDFQYIMELATKTSNN